MDRAVGMDWGPAKAAVEMALLDLAGKQLGVPVSTLLGGAVRDRVPLSHSIGQTDADKMAALAREKLAEGFGTIKLKVGEALEADVERTGAVRAAIGPGPTMRVDANGAWTTVDEAERTIRAIVAAVGTLELVEQPMPRASLAEMAELRRRLGGLTKIMADESCWDPVETAELIATGAVDVVSVYVHESGGVLKAARNLAMAHAAGMTGLIGAMPELGIGTAAHIHIALAATELAHDSDCCGSIYWLEDFITEPLRIEGGFAYAPPGTVGLGVELDAEAVARWSRPEVDDDRPRPPVTPKPAASLLARI
jgi:muconate cycloisomerase